MKVKASGTFYQYRLKALGIDKKDFRKIQEGKTVDITTEAFKKCKAAYVEVKEVKDGSTKQLV